jgi:hypothetical protein
MTPTLGGERLSARLAFIDASKIFPSARTTCLRSHEVRRPGIKPGIGGSNMERKSARLGGKQLSNREPKGKRLTPAQAARAIKQVWQQDKRGLIDLVRIGNILAQQREGRPLTQWEQWIQEKLPFSPLTARQYVRLHRAFELGRTSGTGF